MSTELRIESGKYYVTQDGCRAYVVGLSPLFEEKIYVGTIITPTGIITVSWDSKGRATSERVETSLVGPWVEKIKAHGFIALLKNAPGIYAFDKDPRLDRSDVIGCQKVFLVEGDGMCGSSTK